MSLKAISILHCKHTFVSNKKPFIQYFSVFSKIHFLEWQKYDLTKSFFATDKKKLFLEFDMSLTTNFSADTNNKNSNEIKTNKIDSYNYPYDKLSFEYSLADCLCGEDGFSWFNGSDDNKYNEEQSYERSDLNNENELTENKKYHLFSETSNGKEQIPIKLKSSCEFDTDDGTKQEKSESYINLNDYNKKIKSFQINSHTNFIYGRNEKDNYEATNKYEKIDDAKTSFDSLKDYSRFDNTRPGFVNFQSRNNEEINNSYFSTRSMYNLNENYRIKLDNAISFESDNTNNTFSQYSKKDGLNNYLDSSGNDDTNDHISLPDLIKSIEHKGEECKSCNAKYRTGFNICGENGFNENTNNTKPPSNLHSRGLSSKVTSPEQESNINVKGDCIIVEVNNYLNNFIENISSDNSSNGYIGVNNNYKNNSPKKIENNFQNIRLNKNKENRENICSSMKKKNHFKNHNQHVNDELEKVREHGKIDKPYMEGNPDETKKSCNNNDTSNLNSVTYEKPTLKNPIINRIGKTNFLDKNEKNNSNTNVTNMHTKHTRQEFKKDYRVTGRNTQDENPNKGKVIKPREVCDVCGKQFASLAARQRHALFHVEVRPYRCELCGIGFKLKVHLKKHNLYKHTDEYPCECRVCGKRFKDSSAVRLHERIHSSERPFQCQCGKSFKTRENLWGHRHRRPCIKYLIQEKTIEEGKKEEKGVLKKSNMNCIERNNKKKLRNSCVYYASSSQNRVTNYEINSLGNHVNYSHCQQSYQYPSSHLSSLPPFESLVGTRTTESPFYLGKNLQANYRFFGNSCDFSPYNKNWTSQKRKCVYNLAGWSGHYSDWHAYKSGYEISNENWILPNNKNLKSPLEKKLPNYCYYNCLYEDLGKETPMDQNTCNFQSWNNKGNNAFEKYPMV